MGCGTSKQVKVEEPRETKPVPSKDNLFAPSKEEKATKPNTPPKTPKDKSNKPTEKETKSGNTTPERPSTTTTVTTNPPQNHILSSPQLQSAPKPSLSSTSESSINSSPSIPAKTTSSPLTDLADPGVEQVLKPLPVKNRFGTDAIDIKPTPEKLPTLRGVSAARRKPDETILSPSSTKITEEKLPSIIKEAPVAFEVEFGTRKSSAKRNPIQARLEEESQAKSYGKRPPTAAAVERKMRLAEERRERYQEEIKRKASDKNHIIEERKRRIQNLEEKKAEQLRKIINEKKKFADHHRLLREKEVKKKAEEEAKHAQEVAEKAKRMKVEHPEGMQIDIDNTNNNNNNNSRDDTTAMTLSPTASGTPMAIDTPKPPLLIS
jgi:hypothetical protein